MSLLKAYAKIWALGNKNIDNIFNGEVEITEKVDGSQFAFGRINGDLIIRSKGRIIEGMPQENDMFYKAVQQVHSICHIIPDGHVFYGEYLQKPKHNTLAYDRTPRGNIALFGVAKVDFNGNYTFNSRYDALVEYAEQFGVDVVPVIYRGTISSPERIAALLDRVSFLGGQDIEGVVVKNYGQDLLVGGQYIPLAVGKFVSEKFKEVHQRTWKHEHTSGGQMGKLKSNYKTEARWNKAIQHLREAGVLLNDPKDIGGLIKEVQTDLVAEEKENIKEALWKIHGQDIVRNATGGLPEWYKEKLLAAAFEGPDYGDGPEFAGWEDRCGDALPDVAHTITGVDLAAGDDTSVILEEISPDGFEVVDVETTKAIDEAVSDGNIDCTVLEVHEASARDDDEANDFRARVKEDLIHNKVIVDADYNFGDSTHVCCANQPNCRHEGCSNACGNKGASDD